MSNTTTYAMCMCKYVPRENNRLRSTRRCRWSPTRPRRRPPFRAHSAPPGTAQCNHPIQHTPRETCNLINKLHLKTYLAVPKFGENDELAKNGNSLARSPMHCMQNIGEDCRDTISQNKMATTPRIMPNENICTCSLCKVWGEIENRRSCGFSHFLSIHYALHAKHRREEKTIAGLLNVKSLYAIYTPP
jgi:hypothetical protein